MRITCILLIFFLCNYSLYTQTISGIVIDEETQDVLIGVNIILEDGTGTSSDVFGKYNLNTKNGKQTVTFRYIGYEDVVKELFLSNNQNQILDKVYSFVSSKCPTFSLRTLMTSNTVKTCTLENSTGTNKNFLNSFIMLWEHNFKV